MRYRITHTTHYRYSEPVELHPHILRLWPRSDAAQRLITFEQLIHPLPQHQANVIDVGGDTATRLWFRNAPMTELKIQTQADVEIHRTNPFDYWSDPWAIEFPLDYPETLAAYLHPYRVDPLLPMGVDGQVLTLAQDICHRVNGNVGYFLTTLTQTIYERCEYRVRQTGKPYPAGLTWAKKQGSCRDFAVLFVAACRGVGLAARFVSGYQVGDLDQQAHELHAWAEVYVPGGGWRGFDPTLGLAVSDRHIVVATGSHPLQAAPVTGRLKRSGVETQLLTEITLQPIE